MGRARLERGSCNPRWFAVSPFAGEANVAICTGRAHTGSYTSLPCMGWTPEEGGGKKRSLSQFFAPLLEKEKRTTRDRLPSHNKTLGKNWEKCFTRTTWPTVKSGNVLICEASSDTTDVAETYWQNTAACKEGGTTLLHLPGAATAQPTALAATQALLAISPRAHKQVSFCNTAT